MRSRPPVAQASYRSSTRPPLTRGTSSGCRTYTAHSTPVAPSGFRASARPGSAASKAATRSGSPCRIAAKNSSMRPSPSRRLLHHLQVFEQVRHLRHAHLLFQVARHGGKIGNVHGLDILALDDVFLAVFVLQCDGGGRLLADHTVDAAARGPNRPAGPRRSDSG